MRAIEKVVKGFAYFLAGMIILSIFSGITFGFSIVSHFFGGKDTNMTRDFHEVYENIRNIEIDMEASEIILIEGEEFTVDGFDTKNVKLKETSGTLKIKEDSFGFQFFDSGKLVITVPKNSDLETINISAGAGKVSISNINTYQLDLEQGAGLVEILGSSFQKVDLKGGAGRIYITDSLLHDMKLSSGAGSVDIKAVITGDSKIECGVGRLSLNILGNKEDYRLRVEKGLGSILVDNEAYSSDSVIGNGKNQIKVEGGIGSIQIDFAE